MSGDAYARNKDPDTSHEAAQSTDANSLELLVLTVIIAAGVAGLTAEEVTRILGMEKGTTSPRFRPLVRKGLIIDSGRRRNTEAGKRAIVWVAKEFFVMEDEDSLTFVELHNRICEDIVCEF